VRPVGCEVDDTQVMAGDDRVQFLLQDQGDVRVAAEAVVADQHVAGVEVREVLRRLGGVAGAHRRGERVEQQAGGRVEQHQQVRDRKAAAGRLAGRRAERLAQLGRVGHRERRAVDVERAVAVPAVPGVIRLRERRVAHAREHRLVDRQRQSRAGLAPGRAAEVLVAQVAHLLARHVARQHLLDEQRDRRRRVERAALAPLVVKFRSHLFDGRRADCPSDVPLDLL
jgi:hypothetical protein